MSEWTRIPHGGDYDNLDSTLIIPITQKKVHTQNLPRIIQGEENADILTFETDRFYNGVDLTATVISIIYKNANGTFYERAVNVEYSDDKLRFSWAVSKNATACKGILVINLEFDGLDEHKEVITVKSVRFTIEIEPAVSSKDISAYKSDNWVEETNARVGNLENECKELSKNKADKGHTHLSTDITDLDEKLSEKADNDTVASVSQLGMIKLLASGSGQNRSGLVVDEQTGVTYINARADRGIYRDGAGQLQINPATDEEVAAGTEQYKPVTPLTLKIISDSKSDIGHTHEQAEINGLKEKLSEINEIKIELDAISSGLSVKVDKNTIASPTKLGMIKLYGSVNGQNRSGLVVDAQTGTTYVNTRSDRGISRDGAGQIGINPATDAEVEAGTEQYKPVTPKTLKNVVDSLNSEAVNVLTFLSDYIVEPVVEGVTEKMSIKRFMPATTYCIYAGNVPLTENPIPLSRPTVSAAGVFEGDIMTVRFYDKDSAEIGRAKLITGNLFGTKVGKFQMITEETSNE